MNQEQEPNYIALTSPDGREARLAELRRLFPDLFDGEGLLNEKALKQLISEEVGHVTERFRFEWAGKAQSKRFAFAPSKATLVYDAARSVNADGTPSKAGETLQENTSQNLIIEGDNLEVLKLLQASYFEKVKCIYIDPPYNTGKDFIYPDDYSESKTAYWKNEGTLKEGVKLKALTDASGRHHSAWLNFIFPRLLVSRNLLSDDGLIFISIDDREVHNLRKAVDEVFGEENFITQLVWQKKYTRANDAQFFSDNHDHILVYGKNKQPGLIKLLPRSEEADGAYANPDNHPKGPWKATPLHAKSGTEGTFTYTFKNGVTWSPPAGTFPRFSRDTLDELDKGDEIFFGKDGKAVPSRKSFLSEVKDGLTPVTILPYSEVGHTHESNQELKDLGLEGVFQNPKPTRLIERVIELATTSSADHLVMDFFAGSGTTAHAVMKKNIKDGGNRRFICVQLPEVIDSTQPAYTAGFRKISDVTIERVKRASAALLASHSETAVSVGFRVMQLTESKFPANLYLPSPDEQDGKSLAALNAHLAQANQKRMFEDIDLPSLLTEVALKNGFGLSFQVERISEIQSNVVQRIFGNQLSALVCLDGLLDPQTIELLKPHKDSKLIVRRDALDTSSKFALKSEFVDNLLTV